MKLLLYCTKDRYKHLYDLTYVNNGEIMFAVTQHNKYSLVANNYVNGKIVARCDCNFVERIDVPYPAYFYEVKDRLSHITEKSCLSLLELHHYLRTDTGYGLHFEDVEVFEKPKELCDYGLKRSPQNMCYCFDENGNKCILLSIHPEPLRDIVNGKKTIEVRRKILDELKKLIV